MDPRRSETLSSSSTYSFANFGIITLACHFPEAYSVSLKAVSVLMKIAFVHPDLGIGGAERLVVDAALGLQKRGHEVVVYTSYHDPSHCFDETRDGTLKVLAHDPSPYLPRSILHKFHILMAHLRQIHLTLFHILPDLSSERPPDVYFVDQLSTCVPFIRELGKKRVVFYCHFPDFLLADGEFREGERRRRGGLLKRIYRLPMDWWEEYSTGHSDIILANSGFTARIFETYFTSLRGLKKPKVVWPGINIGIYEEDVNWDEPDVKTLHSDRPTLLSINRFEKKKNAALAVSAYALARKSYPQLRLVLAGGYDPRLEDNMLNLFGLIDLIKANSLTYHIITPSSSAKSLKLPAVNTTPENPDVLFVLNFTTSQRTALLRSPNTKVLMYTPTNEHFGIGPVEGMLCSLPILACASGGPLESVVTSPPAERTGWLCPPEAESWATALGEVLSLTEEERTEIGRRGKKRAHESFSMEGMSVSIEKAVLDAVRMGDVEDGKWRVFLVTIFAVLIAYLVGQVIIPMSWRLTFKR